MDLEAPTRARLRRALEADFEVFEGWSGRHKHGGEKVRYDLVIRPRPHLIQRGFDDGYVVIEVKHFMTNGAKAHDVKARDLLWQCVVYSFSEIESPEGQAHRPLFVLYFIAGDGLDPACQEEFHSLRAFVQRGGVGALHLQPHSGWSMVFGGSNYFTKQHGRGPHNVGVKRQTGSAR